MRRELDEIEAKWTKRLRYVYLSPANVDVFPAVTGGKRQLEIRVCVRRLAHFISIAAINYLGDHSMIMDKRVMA